MANLHSKCAKEDSWLQMVLKKFYNLQNSYFKEDQILLNFAFQRKTSDRLALLKNL